MSDLWKISSLPKQLQGCFEGQMSTLCSRCNLIFDMVSPTLLTEKPMILPFLKQLFITYLMASWIFPCHSVNQPINQPESPHPNILILLTCPAQGLVQRLACQDDQWTSTSDPPLTLPANSFPKAWLGHRDWALWSLKKKKEQNHYIINNQVSSPFS